MSNDTCLGLCPKCLNTLLMFSQPNEKGLIIKHGVYCSKCEWAEYWIRNEWGAFVKDV